MFSCDQVRRAAPQLCHLEKHRSRVLGIAKRCAPILVADFQLLLWLLVARQRSSNHNVVAGFVLVKIGKGTARAISVWKFHDTRDIPLLRQEYVIQRFNKRLAPSLLCIIGKVGFASILDGIGAAHGFHGRLPFHPILCRRIKRTRRFQLAGRQVMVYWFLWLDVEITTFSKETKKERV